MENPSNRIIGSLKVKEKKNQRGADLKHSTSKE